MVKQVHGLYHKNLEVMKLVIKLHQRSPRVVDLGDGLYHGCLDSEQRISNVMKPIMELHLGSLKVEFIINLHHESSKECEASIETSP